MRKKLVALIVLFSISACGTIRTVPENAQLKLKHSSKLNNNPCKQIPRVYSGVIFNSCLMFGPPNPYAPSEYAYFFFAMIVRVLKIEC